MMMAAYPTRLIFTEKPESEKSQEIKHNEERELWKGFHEMSEERQPKQSSPNNTDTESLWS